MAAKWWRYNSTSHIFEQSLNEGDTWTIPPLNASIITEGVFDAARIPLVIPPNIAYTNVTNQFTLPQRISNAGGELARLTLIETNAVTDKKNWQILNISEELAFWALNDAENAVMGAASITRTGNIKCTGITVSGNIHNSAGYIYPGDIATGGGIQGTWYLSSHSSYGLYTNTAFYLEGAVYCAGLSVRNVMGAHGYGCRQGIPGPAQGNSFNFAWNGTVQAWIDASYIGNISMASDARIKRDFTPLVPGSLEKIKQFKPGTFFYHKITELPADPVMHVGLRAQDVLAIAPELVYKTTMITPLTEDGILNINYTEIIPVLIAAIQELAQKIEAN